MSVSSSSTISFAPTELFFSNGGSRCKFPGSQLGFRPKLHHSAIMCEGKKHREAMVFPPKSTKKEKLKLSKGLSNSGSSDMGLSLLENTDVTAKSLSELSHLLMAHLQQVKKEIKRKGKEEKGWKKAFKKMMKSFIKQVDQYPSPPNSFESSQTSNGTKVNFVSTQSPPQEDIRQAVKESVSDTMENKSLQTTSELQQVQQPEQPRVIEVRHQEPIRPLPSSAPGCCATANGIQISSVRKACSERIEVCMVGKCKKLGSAALLEELQRKIGGDGAVVGCKCMGKCRSSPNMRLSNGTLYTQVGLQDIDRIASSFLGEEEDR